MPEQCDQTEPPVVAEARRGDGEEVHVEDDAVVEGTEWLADDEAGAERGGR
jgi:hypothetical protein